MFQIILGAELEQEDESYVLTVLDIHTIAIHINILHTHSQHTSRTPGSIWALTGEQASVLLA